MVSVQESCIVDILGWLSDRYMAICMRMSYDYAKYVVNSKLHDVLNVLLWNVVRTCLFYSLGIGLNAILQGDA